MWFRRYIKRYTDIVHSTFEEEVMSNFVDEAEEEIKRFATVNLLWPKYLICSPQGYSALTKDEKEENRPLQGVDETQTFRYASIYVDYSMTEVNFRACSELPSNTGTE